VISDFESAAYLYGHRYESRPLDRQHAIMIAALDIVDPRGGVGQLPLSKGIVKSKLPGPPLLITTFFFPD